MTGEITLRGRVLPVGGIRDKVLAAQRAGIRTVVLPRQNEVDLEEVPSTIRRRLRFVLVDHIDEVLRAVLGPKKRTKAKSKSAAKKGGVSSRTARKAKGSPPTKRTALSIRRKGAK